MGNVTLEDALFPTVALEVHKPIYNASGVVFAAVGDVVLARGCVVWFMWGILIGHLAW